MDVLMDYINELNWVAVLSGALAAFVVGFVWYSEKMFAAQWMKGAGLTKTAVKNADMVKPIVGGLLTVVLTAVGLGVLYDVLALEGAVDGALLGALVAVAFVVSNKVMHSLFEQKSTTYMLITGAGDIVALAVMGGVLGLLN